MSDECPVCSPGNCPNGYPHLWRRLREDPERWMIVHEMVNHPPAEPMKLPTPEDLALRKLVEDHGCCG